VVQKKRQTATDAELAVLKILWERGPLTARAIAEEIYPKGAESEFAAVHSFLQRLERKGLVGRDRTSFVHVFSANCTQAEVVGAELKVLARRLGEKSLAPLIMQLISDQALSKREMTELRRFIDEHRNSGEKP
jgi:predicted transcriptional regulator